MRARARGRVAACLTKRAHALRRPWLIYASLINQATIGLFYGAPNTKEFVHFVATVKANMLGTIPRCVASGASWPGAVLLKAGTAPWRPGSRAT